MAQYFTQQQIEEYRQCFTLYCPNGYARNATHLRYVMRSLGCCPTVLETIQYVQKYDQKLDFSSFLEILHEEKLKNDPVQDIASAFHGINPENQGWITVSEFMNILTSVGEKMSHEEIFNVLHRMNVTNDHVSFDTLLSFIAVPPTYCCVEDAHYNM